MTRDTHLPPKMSRMTRSSTDFVVLDDVRERPLEWLWPPFVVGNGITVIDGRAGCNKTTLAATLAAHVSSGGHPQTVDVRSGGAIIISGEDDPASVLRPRIEAAGGDLRRIRVYDAINAVDDFVLPDAVGRLEAECLDIDAKLIVIDPLSSFIRGSTASERSVRRALTPLRALALRRGVAVVLIRHVTKSRSKDLLNAGIGSTAISGIARSVLSLSCHDEKPELRVLTQVKGNLTKGTPICIFEIQDDGYGHPMINWTSVSDQDAEVMAAEFLRQFEHPKKLREAIKFLRGWLTDREPVRVSELRNVAAGMGISMPTMNRAKSALHVRTVKLDYCGGWAWELPKKIKDPSIEERQKTEVSAGTPDPGHCDDLERHDGSDVVADTGAGVENEDAEDDLAPSTSAGSTQPDNGAGRFPDLRCDQQGASESQQ